MAVFISGVNTNSHDPWSARNEPGQPNVMRFMNELIDHLKADQNGRDVFVTGFSGGAMMTHTMACLSPQKIKVYETSATFIKKRKGTCRENLVRRKKNFFDGIQSSSPH